LDNKFKMHSWIK